MNAKRFNMTKPHDETCCFEVRDNIDLHKVRPCGQKAVGRFGEKGKKFLCEEHFDYATTMHGLTVENER